MKRKLCLAALTVLLAAAAVTAAWALNELPQTVYVAQGSSFIWRDGLLSAGAVGETMSVSADGAQSFRSYFKLFGIVPVKEVTVVVAPRTQLIPGGIPFGAKMFTEGVLIVGFSDVAIGSGAVCPARQAGLELGDVIVSINSRAVLGNEDIAEIVAASGGEPIVVEYTRGALTGTASVIPAAAADGSGYRAGMWVRDSAAGIGTLTYIDAENGIAAGLGHAIADTDTGVIMPLGSGELVKVEIISVVRGVRGTPGELKGVFSDEIIAELVYNGEAGIFARLRESWQAQSLPIAFRQEIREGDAQILLTLSGSEPQLYDIIIEKVRLSDSDATQNMVIRVTDAELIAATGGIVQGMSGSPIIQDGFLVGALTHVFVNEPTRGYGIFIENMLAAEMAVLDAGQSDSAA